MSSVALFNSDSGQVPSLCDTYVVVKSSVDPLHALAGSASTPSLSSRAVPDSAFWAAVENAI